MERIRIISRQNGVGLDRDVALLTEALRPLGTIEYASQRRPEHLLTQVRASLTREWSADRLYLMVERMPPLIGRLPGLVGLVPNQERFPRRHLSRLRHVDLVLCKTRHAIDVFSEQNAPVAFIGFTSVDRDLNLTSADYDRFLHLAGRSTLKGTETLVEVWSRHPEWPELTLIQCSENAPSGVPENIRLITEYLPDTELQELQNSHGVHICPSRSEGWGHYVVEGMSCGAVVVTTDGPPMNELIAPTRGVLVPWHRSEARHLGTNWYVDPDALEEAIQSVIDRSWAEKSALGAAARSWYEDNDATFHNRVNQVIAEMFQDRHPSVVRKRTS